MSHTRIIETRTATTSTSPLSTPKIYVLTTNKTNSKDSRTRTTARIDRLSQTAGNDGSDNYAFSGQLRSKAGFPSFIHPYYLLNQLLTLLSALFLPTGYPHSVTADYTPYQIYDSLQAFASAIAGLLSSRAVLQSLNVLSGNEHDANAATYATLLSIATSTLSNLTTILFAARAAPRINVDVKFYRFLADVVNDAAFILDLLAPSLPQDWAFLNALSMRSPKPSQMLVISTNYIPSPRVLALCCSAVFRAVCGVAGGSSKAVLSSHFARNNPEHIGELNAKDGSQETVVNLVGMWVGGVLVSRVQGLWATWAWMLGLLVCHLGANWMAVKSVTFTWLNASRAMLVLDSVRSGERPERYSVPTIGRRDSILGFSSLLRPPFWKTWKTGASFEELVVAFGAVKKGSSGSLVLEEKLFLQLVKIFENESYILWYDVKQDTATILLKQSATPIDQLKSWYAGLELFAAGIDDRNSHHEQILHTMQERVKHVDNLWPSTQAKLGLAGWNLNNTVLEYNAGIRVEFRNESASKP